ncbi:Heteroproteinous nuclear ribonucleoprotein U-like protein 1 [Actinomortierella wolfii]|nr:Heteroproteinous nuclear ribonucleoprotein U-like protein 1 [Actinomortierella wolfii]
MEGEVSTFGGFTANPGSQVVEFHHPFQYGLDGNSSAMTVESSNSNAAEWQVRPVTPSASSISSATNINSDVSQPDTVVHATSTAHSSQRTSVDDRLTLRHLRVSAFSSHSSLSDTAPVACESEDTIMEQDVTPIPTSTAFAPAGYALSSEEPARDSEQGRQTYMEDSARSDSRGDGDHDDEDDVDDDDDGIDLVIQSRQNLVPETRSFVASAPPMFSTASLHPVEHAQLSPRSAAALTSSMHAGRSSWGEPSQVTSSITNQLPAMTRQQQTHNYENNPYFRRASISILTNHYDSTTAGMPSPMTQEHGFESEQSVNDVSSSSVNSHSEPHCSDGSRPLSFEVVYADGGDFNESHSVDNVLKNDGTVYCSRRSSNINICLKLAEAEQSFVLTGFKARAPTSGFTAPCKEGLIFVSHDPIPLERVSVFDNMTKDRYDEYMRRMTHEGGIEAMLEKHGANFVDSFMPAAFFQLESPEESCSIEFNPARSGRYVLIKLLRARGVNSECPENIDVQYLGLYGYTGTRSFASGQLL